MNSGFETFSSIVMIIILILIGVMLIVMIVDLVINGTETPKSGWKKYLYNADILGCLIWHKHDAKPATMAGGDDSLGYYKLFGGCGDCSKKKTMGGCGDCSKTGGCGDCPKFKGFGNQSIGGTCSSSPLTYDPRSFLQ